MWVKVTVSGTNCKGVPLDPRLDLLPGFESSASGFSIFYRTWMEPWVRNTVGVSARNTRKNAQTCTQLFLDLPLVPHLDPWPESSDLDVHTGQPWIWITVWNAHAYTPSLCICPWSTLRILAWIPPRHLVFP